MNKILNKEQGKKANGETDACILLDEKQLSFYPLWLIIPILGPRLACHFSFLRIYNLLSSIINVEFFFALRNISECFVCC